MSAAARADIDETLRAVLDGRGDAEAWIRAAARRHGVVHEPGPVDRFVDDVSRLSDAGIRLDRVETLLLALARAGVVTDGERFGRHAAYLRRR